MIEHLIHTLQSLKIGLKVVDGSLKINAPKGTLTTEIVTEIKAHKSELIALLSSTESIPKTEEKDAYVLTSSQQRLWALSQFEAGNTAYNIFNAFEFTGKVDINAFSLAYTRLIERHESLRTIFKEDAGGVLGQYIISKNLFPSELRYVDVSASENRSMYEAYIEAFKQHTFDLQTGPLFIGELVRVASDRYILMFNMHHIIGDGWSMGILNKEFIAIYNGITSGKEVQLAELPIQYKDYSEWQTTSSRKSTLDKSKAFWLDTFSGELPVLELPSNQVRPKLKTYNGSGFDYAFSKEFTSQLNAYAQQNEVSLFMVLMAGLNGLFSRYTNTQDIILGTPVAGREHSDLENQVGLYLNTLAIRTTFEKETTFADLVSIQKQTLLNAYSHQEFPFDKLVEELDVKRDLSRSALFDVMVAFQNQQELLESTNIILNGTEVVPYEIGEKTLSKFDISLSFIEIEGQLLFHVEYNTDIYELNFIQQLSTHLNNFLSSCIQNANQSISRVHYLNELEQQQLLEVFNNTSVSYPEGTLVDLFVAQVAKTPNAIAITFGEKKLTYKELDEVSNEFAHYLLSNYTINIEDLIGVKLDRSEWLIISLLAVLKVGCAYVPIDTKYPQQRIDYIELDSNCKVTIDDNLVSAFARSNPITNKLPAISILPNNLAYVIYTSGSTGKPKGVMVEHRSVVNLCFWHMNTYQLDNSSRGSLYAGIGFDASVWEIYPYLLSGGSLYPIADSEIRYDVHALVEFLNENKITHSYLPTKISEELVIQDVSLPCTKILTGGESLTLPEGDQNVHIYNNYGPSENTVVTTSFDLQDRVGESIPIGTPVFNNQLYIISEQEELQPIGVVGEICISGDGLSRGYLNRPELTAEKFVDNRFRESGKLYKTGDLGKWLPNGMIEFVGRKDTQIKIRGYRVELGEIENALKDTTFIDQAVVLDVDIDGDKMLVAYYVSSKEVEKQVLRGILEKELPDYMIPSYYVALKNIPLTANGKVDKTALPEIEQEDLIRNEYIAPTTALEKQLGAIWEEVLGVEKVGITDNFFELGGHSLKVTLIVNKIKKELGLELSVKDMFLQPTISGITSLVKTSTHTTIPKVAEQESYVLTSSQRRLWMLSQFKEGSVAYNIPVVYELKGVVNVVLFREAFKILIERHESLRTSFKRDDQGEVKQYIYPSDKIDATIEVFDSTISEDQEIEVARIINDCNAYCFDLSKAPLITCNFIKQASDRYLLLLNMHHIISDGWSMEVMSREFMMIYDSLQKGEDLVLPELSIQYKDYSEWLASEKQQTKLSVSEDYWIDKFSGELPILELPAWKARPKVKTYNGDSVTHQFSKSISTQLRTFSSQNEVSLFMVLMAGVNGLLSRYTSAHDIILGTPVAGRDHADLEHQVGLYLNTLAIRTTFDPTVSFDDLLVLQKNTLLEAYSHQEYPLDSLVEALNLQRDVSRSALFDVIVVLQNQQDLFSSESSISEGLEIRPYTKNHRKVSQFDLSFIFSETTDQLTLHLEYNTDIYDGTIIKNLVSHLENFLSSCLQDSSQSISALSYLDASEKQQLLEGFNNTTVTFPGHKTLVTTFTDQVEKTPDGVAIVFGETVLTYAALDTLSNQLAHYLLSNYDFKTEDLIAVKLDRSEWLVITLLAILKAGCAYVPIDPTYPKQRIKYIEEDSNCVLTIDEVFVNSFKAIGYTFTSLPEIHISPSNLAYVIYTSGSTGKPKGVMIEHKSVVNLCFWYINTYQLGNSSKGSLYAGIGFDASVWEIYPYLLSGGSLYPIADSDIRYDVHALVGFLSENKITHAYLPTKICEELVMQDISLSDTKILTGGEALTLPEGDQNIHIYNNYGPSENTVVTTSFDLRDRVGENIPIGTPIFNNQLYIISDQEELQPIGVVGEICISGVGLSRGYLNKPELTAEKFVDNRFRESGKLYKTGDLGRWLPNGMIEFYGRKDSQIKIRGYRIELGEIENVLTGVETINQAVVVVSDVQGDSMLVAYYTSDEELDKQVIRSILGNELPDYMIPSYYVALENIPLTANGKVDKAVLPEIEQEDLIRNEYVVATTELEEQLVTIWEEVLGVDRVGITDNFFELGGHSLKVTLIVNKIKKELGLELSVKDMFLQPTISGIITYLKESIFVTIPKALEQDSYVLTSSQRRLWVLSQLKEGSIAYNMPIVYELKGTINVTLFREAFKTLVHRHESLRTSFKRDAQGEVRQYIIPFNKVDATIEVFDSTSSEDQEIEVARIINDCNSYCFDLSKAPLITCNFIKQASDHYLLLLNMHHIISDGWSMEVMSREFMMIYDSLQKGEDLVLPELSIQYKDYSEWLASEKQQTKISVSEDYWIDKFSGELPILELPTWKTRPQVKTYNGQYFKHTFSEKSSDLISAFSEKNNVSEFMVLMAGVNGVFSRYTNTSDIIVGTPVAGRDHMDLESQIGLYLNTLAIRTVFDKKVSFDTLLNIQKITLLDAYEHQEYPFDNLIEALNIKRDTSRSALFDVMVVFQNQQDILGKQELAVEGIEISGYTKNHRKVSQFDINFVFSKQDNSFSLQLEYNTDIYDAIFIERMAIHLEQFLQECVINPGTSIAEVLYTTEEEETQLLVDFNKTEITYPSDKTIVELFVEQVTQTPDAVALVFEEKEFTYKELDRVSNQLANYLLSNYDISIEDLISIKLDRSEWLIISLLAVLKTGSAYVPIDTNYPEQRIAYMESDSNFKITIDDILLQRFENSVELNNSLPIIDQTADNLAYIMYTSGSTGNPKGVMVEQRNVVRLVKSSNFYQCTTSDILLSTGAFSFDATTFEYWGMLLNGGCLVLCSKETLLDSHLLADEIINKSVNIMWFTAGWLHQLVDDSIELFSGLSTVLAGGDKLSPAHISKLRFTYPDLNIINGYGPTENTTFSLTHNILEVQGDIPIGNPISNSTAYVLDENMLVVPVGVVGEIYLGGDGLSRGYLNQSELTAEKFVFNRFRESGKLYKTGDLGRLLPSGTIEFVGRKDYQVKIRGHRIELGEIENALLVQDEIKEAVVLVKEINSYKEIIAYIVSSEEVDSQEVRSNLLNNLPEYMIPSYFVALDHMPLTSNGKVDRRLLPEVTEKDIVRKEYVEPKTGLEIKLSNIWQDVLSIDSVGVTDDFFELGGHSLKASKLLSDYQKFCNVKIQMQDIFDNTTIQSHCKLIEEAKEVLYVEIPRTPLSGSYPVSNTQKKMWVASQYDKGSIAYNIPIYLELSIHTQNFEKAIYDVITRHEILRTVFKQDNDGEIRQHILSPEEFVFEIEKIDFQTEENIEDSVQAYLVNDLNTMFDLENGPLLRAALLQVSPTNHIFYINMHHIISDGWSLEVLTKDVLGYYEAYQNNKQPELENLKIQFKDYASWYHSSKDFVEHKAYWLQNFSGEIPKVNLSISDERPAIKTFNGSSFSGEISKEIFSKLKINVETEGISFYMSLMGVVNILLYRYSYQNDIIIGSPFAGRNHPDLKNQIGCYINTIPIRIGVDENNIYNDFIQEVKQTVLNAQHHGSYPFDTLLEDIEYKRDLSRSPLFDIMVVMIQNADKEREIPLEKSMLSTLKLPTSNSKVDLTFFFKEYDDKIGCELVYNTDLFSIREIEKLFEDFITILEKTIYDRSLPIKDYIESILDKTEIIEHNSFIKDLSNSISEDF